MINEFLLLALFIIAMDQDAENTADGLHTEAKRVDMQRAKSKGVCWMYVVIAVEAGVLVTLIYIGLS